jgi:hypothetical protein
LQPAPSIALSEGADLPETANGLPAFYYWKDAIAVGSYVHPARRFSLKITRDRLDRLVNNFSRMKSNGVGVPILMDHAPTASATLGWIVDVKRDGDRLMELHQFLGEEARDIGLRNKVSLGIEPNFVDGKGTAYGEAIVHSAVTPIPVVTNQGEFEPAEKAITLSLTVPEDKAPDVPPGLPGLSPDLQLAINALEQVAAVKRDLALARGAVDPAVAEELFSLLVHPRDGSAGTLLLSRGGSGSSIAIAVFDALSRNRPAPLGETTGIQVLNRSVPGDDSTDLRQRMIALASGGKSNAE